MFDFMITICSLLSIHSWVCADLCVLEHPLKQNNEFDMYRLYDKFLFIYTLKGSSVNMFTFFYLFCFIAAAMLYQFPP